MNFFRPENIPDTGCEHFETLHKSGSFTIERIASNALKHGCWYDQDHDEWVMLMRGRAVIEFEDKEQTALEEGDYLLLEAHRRHRVLETSGDALWLALHLGPL